MKSFLKYLFASVLGFFLSIFLVILIFIGIVSAIVSYSENEVIQVDKNTVLFIDFKEAINDRTPTIGLMDVFALKPNNKIGLNDILKNLAKAKKDPNIEGIFMELTHVQAGISTLDEIREAMADFKKSGKFIKTYSEYMSQSAYYLASISDEIFLNPEGIILFNGLNAQVMFFKGLFDKLDIEAQVVRHGKFKCAVEPFLDTKMSKANKEQTEMYIKSIWNNMLTSIGTSRGIEPSKLAKLADEITIRNPKEALKYGFVDKLIYKDEVIADLKKTLNLKEDENLTTMSLAKYTKSASPRKSRTRDEIAIIYASGTIAAGEGNDAYVGSKGISKAIRKARTNDRVKAIVFRINSGGGDVVASEVIRREIELAAKIKPVIASYGDISASGGYWCTCQATKIIANKTCLTGSIGVFAMIPNIQGLLNNKLGITIDNVSSGKNPGFLSLNRPMTSLEREVIQANIENTYDTFLTHIANGRKLKKKFIDEIGQGRVWSGENAKELGLIDEFGGLNKAIQLATEAAELDNYRIQELPEQKDPLETFIKGWSGTTQMNILENELGDSYKYIKSLKELSKIKGIQARLPFDIIIE
jgi:protease-4